MKKKLSEIDREIFQEELRIICKTSRILETYEHSHHGKTSTYEHSIAVANKSYEFALRWGIPVKKKELIRGALLHDYFLYDWHEYSSDHTYHGFTHPKKALKNASEIYQISNVEKDIIKKHMFPLTPVPPVYIESWIVCIMDKICCTKETLDNIKHIFRKVINVNNY